LETAPTTRWLAGTTTCWPQGRASRPYNARNTDDPKDREYRVEARIDEHSEDVQMNPTLDETYNRQSGVERTNDAGLRPGTFAPEAASTHERSSTRCAFVSFAVNDERGDNPGRTVITL